MKMMMNQLVNPFRMTMNQLQSHRRLNYRGGSYRMWPPAQTDQMTSYISSSKSRNNKNRKGYNNKRTVLLGYNIPKLNILQQQNRLKPRRYISKKKFNYCSKSAPLAPRNTTSFLIRAKKSGGITSLVSPCPVTPAVLPTPNFSPSREVFGDMVKEEWGVDGYGSMKGLIRLRSGGNDEDGRSSGSSKSSESDVEEHVEVERRLDHDLNRFVMIYPNNSGCDHSSCVLENRVDDQDTHIAQLEGENLMLKDRLFLMEREFSNLRTRLQCLEMRRRGARGFIEEVVENDSENESWSRGYGRLVEGCNDVLEVNSADNKETDISVDFENVAANVQYGRWCSENRRKDGVHKIEEKMVFRKSKKRQMSSKMINE